MIAYLQGITRQRSSWTLLLVSALFLEICAMVFQHGLGLSPCVMCIYERAAIAGVAFSALIALIAPRMLLLRLLAVAIGLFSAVKGLRLALQHTDYQLNPAPWNQ